MSCPIEKVTELLNKEGIDATPDMIKALALRAQVMNMIDVDNVAEFKNKKQLKEDRKKAKAETKNETKPEPLKIGDAKAKGYTVMKALWNKTKEINIASLNSPVVSIVKGPASSYSAKTNTLKLSEDSIKDNRTIAHELLHTVTGAMAYARLSDDSKTSLKDVMVYMLDGISEDVVKYDDTSKEDLVKISDVATAELAYLRKAAQGKLSDKMSAEEKFFREFVAIMGSSSGARAKLYGQYKSRESLKKVGMIDKLLRNIVEVAKYVKGILKEILAMDDAALKSNPKYIDMLAIIDDALQDVADDNKSISSTIIESTSDEGADTATGENNSHIEVSYATNPLNYVYAIKLDGKTTKGNDYMVESYTENKNGTVTLKFDDWNYPLTVSKATGKNAKGTWKVDIADYTHENDIKVEKIVDEQDGYVKIFDDPVVYEKRLSSTNIPILDNSGYTFSVRNDTTNGTWTLVEDSTEMSVGITRSNRKDLFKGLKEEATKDNSNFKKLKEVVEKALSNPPKGNWIKRDTNTLQGTPVAEFGEQIGDNEVTEAEAKLLETDGLEVTLDQLTSGGKPLGSGKNNLVAEFDEVAIPKGMTVDEAYAAATEADDSYWAGKVDKTKNSTEYHNKMIELLSGVLGKNVEPSQKIVLDEIKNSLNIVAGAYLHDKDKVKLATMPDKDDLYKAVIEGLTNKVYKDNYRPEMTDEQYFEFITNTPQFKNIGADAVQVYKNIVGGLFMMMEERGGHAVLHEYVHATAVLHMRDNPNSPATKRMETLFKIATSPRYKSIIMSKMERPGKGVDTYWTESVDEFVAEAMSNPRLINALQEVKVNLGSRVANLWGEVRDAILKLAGIAKEDSMYEYVVDGFTALMQEREAVGTLVNTRPITEWAEATTKPEDGTIVYTGKTSLSDLKSLQEGICK